MMAWIREHVLSRKPPVGSLDDLEQLVQRREWEADETVRRERVRQERLTGAFLFDGMNRGVLEEERLQ